LKDYAISASVYFIFLEQSRTFQDIGLYNLHSVNITGLGEPEQAQALGVTDGLLPMLGVTPLFGRAFTRTDDSPNSADTVILTYGYWSRKFGDDRSIIGRTIEVDGKPRAIIGVLPARFHFLGLTNLAMVLPLKLNRERTYLASFNYAGIARLKPDVTIQQANADAERMLPIVDRSFPAPPAFGLKMYENLMLRPNVQPLKQVVVGEVGKVLWVLMGGISLVLVIACANLANLLLVRAEGRQQEMAIRAALGASRSRIAAQLLIESLILAVLVRTFRALTRVNPGFVAPAEVQTFRIAILDAQEPDSERVVRIEEEILRKLEAIPGVSSVGISRRVPMDGSWGENPIFAKDRAYEPDALPLRRYEYVAPGFFNTLGAPIVAGRDFTWRDIYDKVPVVIVSEKFAREFWHTPADAIGKQIRESQTSDWREVVGVAGDIHQDGASKEAPTTVYWPILLANFLGGSDVVALRYATFVIRSPRAGSEGLMNEIRQAVWSVAPYLPLTEINTLNDYYAKSMARTSFTLVMLAIAGGMALFLGIVGLYGVIAYSVSQRRREIGIRMALGAPRSNILRLILEQGLKLTLAGMAIGMAGSLALTKFMASLLYGVSTTDALTFILASSTLVGAAILACWLPARQATKVDPMVALRAE
jgi:ABC-type antimicrobial peptide transport system permease subunit